ncbi:hypothetical protein [Bradyrhizobium liaoningense]
MTTAAFDFYVDKLHSARHPAHMAKQDPNDAYSKAGANALAERIKQFWHDRGFLGVNVQAYQIPGFPSLYGVRSNLAAGLPRWRR